MQDHRLFAMPEDNERLTLVTTIYRGEMPPVELTTDEKLSAYGQAIKFFEDSRNGLYVKIDPSMGEVRDFSRRIFMRRGIRSMCFGSFSYPTK